MNLTFCLTVLLVLFSGAAQALTANAENVEVARSGEGEETVCQRAKRIGHERGAQALLDALKEQQNYQQLLDKAQWRGDSRTDLNDRLLTELSASADYIDMQELWSGRSCLYKGLVQADADAIVERFVGQYAAPSARQNSASRGARDEGITGLGHMMNRANLSSAMSELSPLRMVIMEFWLTKGEWPKSMAQLGFRAEDLQLFRYFHDVTLAKGGVIDGRLKGALSGHSLRYIPEPAAMGSITWRCESSVRVIGESPCRS